jgi:hypothetical protein
MRAALTLSGSDNETAIDAPRPLPTNVMTHLALVLDGASRTMTLYMNGAVQGSTAVSKSLASLKDVNNWLGRSQFAEEP